MFLQIPNSHLMGRGCITCRADSNRSTTAAFIERAQVTHGKRFDYSLVNYIHVASKVKIICPDHGEFLQTPDSHVRGKGCPECGNNQLNTDIFIDRARATHGSIFDYSLVEYVHYDSKVRIICSKHGEFLQTPGKHLHGRGCPDCAEYGYKGDKPGTLYYVRFDLPELTLWKVGITNRTVKERFIGFEVKPITLWERRWTDGSIADELEDEILNDPRYDRYRYNGPAVLKSGSTECFTIDIMALGYSRNISRLAA